MQIEGYEVPDNLVDAQAQILTLLIELAHARQTNSEILQTQENAVAMIEAARKALNAVEAPMVS